MVLEPQPVADLLLFLGLYGFNGLAVIENRSFVRLGEAQFDPAITLWEDPADPLQTGIGFDVEGTPKRPVPLVEAGVTTGTIHTRRTARKLGVESTGHAVEGAEGFGALPTNPVLGGGSGSINDLVSSMGRGLLVTDFWYTRILDPRTQVVTGLTRNGVWLVEDGRIVRPVSNLQFTQSYVEALAPGAVLGVSAERQLLAGEFDASYVVPALHLAQLELHGRGEGMTTQERRRRLEQFGGGYAAVEAAVDGATEAELDRRPVSREWTAREVVHHLADSEAMAYTRLRRLIAEDDAVIPGIRRAAVRATAPLRPADRLLPRGPARPSGRRASRSSSR